MLSDSENTSNRSVAQNSIHGINGPCSSTDRDDDSGSESSSLWEDDDGPKNGPQGLATAVLQSPMPTAIFMEGSKDVHVGPRLHYNAPVTINQYVKVLKPEPVTETELVAKAVESPLDGVKPEANGVKFNEPIDEKLMLSNGKRIFTKEEWGVHRPRYARELPHPTTYVVISHTATDVCFVSKICAVELRSIQDYHVGELDMPDIGHNFLVDGDGNVYEGRGWDATNMHGGFVKRINLGVGLIGHFLYNQPTAVQMESTQLLLDKGVEMGKLDPDYKLFSHNWTMPTESSGPNVYRIISTWDHFTIPGANLNESN